MGSVGSRKEKDSGAPALRGVSGAGGVVRLGN